MLRTRGFLPKLRAMTTSAWVPPWEIDPEQIEQILLALRQALTATSRHPSLSFKPAALVGPLGDLATTTARLIQDLAQALQDREAVSAATWIRPADEMQSLAVVVSAIQSAWRDRVLATIDSGVWPTLGQLLDDYSPSLLSILGRTRDENSHSDVLRWLLSPRTAPNLAAALLKVLISRLESAAEWEQRIAVAIQSDCLSVRREVRMGPETEDANAADRIDLLVTGPGLALAIENKIWSAEHDNQTATYARWLGAMPGDTLTAGIFLTPRGHPAASPFFRPLSYLELTRCLLEAARQGSITPTERSVLAGYLKSLREHVLRNELRVIPPTKEST
jgi:hypothetical protein